MTIPEELEVVAELADFDIDDSWVVARYLFEEADSGDEEAAKKLRRMESSALKIIKR